jgi:hypothetical protein
MYTVCAQTIADALCRLTSLPPGVLWHIVRRMGRRSRVVSRALLDAYGPLDCRLVLRGGGSLTKLLRMLKHREQRLPQITSLQLCDQVVCEAELTELVDSIAAHATKLASLSLLMADVDLPFLAPLRHTLLALEVSFARQPLDPDLNVIGLKFLTNLTSLKLARITQHANTVDHWRSALRRLPQLLHLSWFPDSSIWTPHWLADLRQCVPQLTSLCLGYASTSQAAWGNGNTAAMQEALKGLRSLSLRMKLFGVESEASADAVVSALSLCTWIERVHLSLHLRGWHPLLDLPRLSAHSVRLASVDLVAEKPYLASRLAGMVQALGPQSHVTMLGLSYFDSSPYGTKFTCPELPSSLAELRVAGHWAPAALLRAAVQLPCLRRLELSHTKCLRWSAAATEQLGKLAQLQTLRMELSPPPVDLLLALSGLTALAELQLKVPPMLNVHRTHQGHIVECRAYDGDITDADLLHLAPLKAQLTRLHLEGLHLVSATGLAALLGELTSLQQLELELWRVPGAVGGGLKKLLTRLQCVSSVQLVGAGMAEERFEELALQAQAHGFVLRRKAGDRSSWH